MKEEHLTALYHALEQLDLHRIGFHKINDIVTCPRTDTCNLGIANSMCLADELQKVIETEFYSLINTHDIQIKISGCMNACGQHTLAHIVFQGMTLKSNGLIGPATQILFFGGSSWKWNCNITCPYFFLDFESISTCEIETITVYCFI